MHVVVKIKIVMNIQQSEWSNYNSRQMWKPGIIRWWVNTEEKQRDLSLEGSAHLIVLRCQLRSLHRESQFWSGLAYQPWPACNKGRRSRTETIQVWVDSAPWHTLSASCGGVLTWAGRGSVHAISIGRQGTLGKDGVVWTVAETWLTGECGFSVWGSALIVQC